MASLDALTFGVGAFLAQQGPNAFAQRLTWLIDPLASMLTFFHDIVSPVVGNSNGWGWGIVMLTMVIKTALLPLAIKQVRSMRAMSQLQPEMKKIQEKYKADRSMMRTDPQKFQERRQKQQEAMMGLYKEHGVNPAASCLPLLLQMPILVALFQVLLPSNNFIEGFEDGTFYFVSTLVETAGIAGLGGISLIVVMAATMFASQKQMMANNPSAQAMPQQKILLYVMPLMLGVFGWNMPVGVLLYWVTQNVWTIGQQFFMFRNVQPAPATK